MYMCAAWLTYLCLQFISLCTSYISCNITYILQICFGTMLVTIIGHQENIEESHIDRALEYNGYPVWIRHIARKLADRLSREKQEDEIRPEAVIRIPYIPNLSEGLRRIVVKVGIQTVFSHNNTAKMCSQHKISYIRNGKDRYIIQI